MSGNKYSSIFQALDNSNHKGALKLCNALLKKKSDDSLGKLLKAICLQRLNEVEEAIKLADEVSLVPQTQEVVLNNLNYFYKSVKQTEKIVKAFEVSYNAQPKNEELAEGLFLAYTKVRNLKQQQQMAIQINKMFPSREHSVWYLMTILAMVKQDPENKLFIQLSQKMAEKLAGEKKFQSTEDLYLYEEILDVQSKYDEHLKIIQGDLGKLYTVPTEQLKIQANLQDKLGLHKESMESYKEIITRFELDEWSCYMGYFDQVWKVAEKESQGKVDKEALVGLVKSIQDQIKTSNQRILRGPYIAELEIEYRFIMQLDSNDDKKPIDNGRYLLLKELIYGYFKTFGNKPIYYYDMKKYLNLINSRVPLESKKEFLKGLWEMVSGQGERDRISHISNYYKVESLLSLHSELTEVQVRDLLSKFVTEYQLAFDQQKSTQQLSERVPGDDLLIIGYQLLMDLFDKSQETRYLVDAVVLLEYGFEASPKNFQFNLMAISLYYQLGDHRKALDHFRVLNIKNIQWDTIGYLILDDCIRSLPSMIEAYKFFEKSSKFYAENDSTADYIAECYKNHNYSKIFELQKFQDKISNSYQQLSSVTEKALFTFFLSKHKSSSSNNTSTTTTKDQQQSINIQQQLNLLQVPEHCYTVNDDQFKKLSFNMDLNVQDRFESDLKRLKYHYQVSTSSLSLQSNNDNHVSCGKVDQEFLKSKLVLRRLVLRLLVDSYRIKGAGTTVEQVDKYMDNIKLLSETIEKVKNVSSTPGLEITSDRDFDNIVYQQTVQVFTIFVEIYNQMKLNKNHLSVIQDLLKQYSQSNDALLKYIRDNMYISGSGVINARVFRMIANHFEQVTWFTELMGYVYSWLPSKKQKKKDETIVALRVDFDQCITKQIESLQSLDSEISKKSISTVTDYTNALKLTHFSTSTENEEVESLITKHRNNTIQSITQSTSIYLDEVLLYIKSLKSQLTPYLQ
ncbi:N-acetyltransferase [Tieghemostelium lacteum]|uniref:N-acetyltransferase n=1 Tax=Tieghemostelium lacteum TaxID=361077 RepID=A0A151ZFT8_TIELA|nr:N-acetyltransferase [Tieghemostelium lacteum]|eukprot:KYQ92730.1 N-acetyltransferase [Tieghemostelium lacteum]